MSGRGVLPAGSSVVPAGTLWLEDAHVLGSPTTGVVTGLAAAGTTTKSVVVVGVGASRTNATSRDPDTIRDATAIALRVTGSKGGAANSIATATVIIIRAITAVGGRASG